MQASPPGPPTAPEPGRLGPASLLLGVLFACLVFWLPIAFFVHGVSPSNPFEESVGYRYFYALRNVFAREFPWIPQGQLPNLSHRAIQVLLDWMGYARTDLHDRLDLFSFLAVLVPLLLSALLAALVFARSRLHPLAVAAVFAAIPLLWAPPTPVGWTVLPDYHIWVVPLALAAMWTSAHGPTLGTSSQAIATAALAAAAVSIKLSFLVFAFPAAALLAATAHRRRQVLKASLYLTAGFVILVVAVLALYFPTASNVREWTEGMLQFVRSHRATLPAAISGWNAFREVPWLLVALAAQGVVALAGFVRRRPDTIAMAVGGILLVAFMAERPYSYSYIELHAYLFMEAGILALSLSFSRLIGQTRLSAALPAGLAGLVLAVYAAWQFIWVEPVALLAHSSTLAASSATFDRRLNVRAGDVWILTTGNEYRPFSVHSALCKGGSGIFEPYWGQSRYLRDLFPNFHCAVVPNGVVQEDLADSTVGFRRFQDESVQESVRRVESYFFVTLAPRPCTDIEGNGFGYVVCDPLPATH